MMEERKLPGDPQPLDEFIKRWEWRWKPRWGPPSDRELFEILSAMYRWRIQLDCGCIIERYTEGPDADTVDELAEISDSVLYSGASTFRLPPGSLDCRYESGKECPRFAGEGPVRDIVTWKHREPQIQTMQRYQLAGTWIEKRQYAIWHVALSCGHPYQETAPPDWCPEDGFPPQEAPQPLPGKQTYFAKKPAGDGEYWERLCAMGMPDPAPFGQCRVCGDARSMVAYERVGWMVPPPPPPLPPPPPGPTTEELQARLRRAEAAALRAQKRVEEARQHLADGDG